MERIELVAVVILVVVGAHSGLRVVFSDHAEMSGEEFEGLLGSKEGGVECRLRRLCTHRGEIMVCLP
jgi:hypothetical protein